MSTCLAAAAPGIRTHHTHTQSIPIALGCFMEEEALPLATFGEAMEARNAQLRERLQPELIEEELLAARLCAHRRIERPGTPC